MPTPDMSHLSAQARARSQAQRIQTLIIVLSMLNVPFLVLGIVDLRSSPTTLMLVLSNSAYYAIYYALNRAGYGVSATYGWMLLQQVILAMALHNGGGFLGGISAFYLVLLICIGIVLNDTRALAVTAVCSLLSYGATVAYELLVAPPQVFEEIYQNPGGLAMISVIMVFVSSIVVIWLIMRSNILSLRKATAGLEAARAEAEAQAQQNAVLLSQVQNANQSLLTTEQQLRTTIDALSLPLIPLHDGVAVLPLIGFFDETRAAKLVEELLNGIYKLRIREVVIDITGLDEVDTHVAGVLLQAAMAVRLLGASVILSGVSASAAQALVGLGADLSTLRVIGNLGDALRRNNLEQSSFA